MRKVRLSQLENKTEQRVKAIRRKYFHKAQRIGNAIKELEEFKIPVSEVTISAAKDKIEFYIKCACMVNAFWNWKFNENYKGSLPRYFET